uniref:Uncharacterized protein n=1 Tax=Ditylenchus dipsaci TaxID=166011 RepID=A0A915CUN9_9BILA
MPLNGEISSSTDGEITNSEMDGTGIEQLTTKIYYNVDDQPMPYSTEVPVPPSQVTLADFKQFINRRNYKFYYKVMDPVLKTEVKTDILNEEDVLKPNVDGRFELFLLSDNTGMPGSSSTTSTIPIRSIQNRASVRAGTLPRNLPPPHTRMQQRYFDDSSSQEESNLFGDSNVRMNSDEDSQCSTNFTSVSQQQGHRHNNKRYDSSNKPTWARDRRRKPKKAYSSFLSSTFDDTEVSMALDLITVTFNLDTRLPFGMSVITRQTGNYCGIYVHEVIPNGLVALDGRIKPNFLLLEVNDVSLDRYEQGAAVEVLKNAVRVAVETRGHLKLTCARSDLQEPTSSVNMFRLPQEPVRPIDPMAWVQHCNAVRGLNIISEESENGMSPLPPRNSQHLQNVQHQAQPFGTSSVLPPNHMHTSKRLDVNGGELSHPNHNVVLPPPPPPPSSSNNAAVVSGVPGWPSSGVGSSIGSSGNSPTDQPYQKPYNVHMDKLSILRAMADPNSGIDVCNRTWLKIPMEKSFWKNVEGLEERCVCERYASELLRDGLILQAVSKNAFTQQCYYTFSNIITDSLNPKSKRDNTMKRGALTLIQNPAINTADLTGTTLGDESELHKTTKCASGIGCAVKRMFCIHPKHSRKAVPSNYKNKSSRKLTKSKKKHSKENSTHIP